MVGTPRWVCVAVVSAIFCFLPSTTQAFNGRFLSSLSSFGARPSAEGGASGFGGYASYVPAAYGAFGSGSLAYCPTIPSYSHSPYSYSSAPYIGTGLSYTYGVYDECVPRSPTQLIGTPVHISPEPPLQYATPTPAPPSRTNEPPLLTEAPVPPPPPLAKEPAKKGDGWKRTPPIITETRSIGANFAGLPGEKARVGFWNLTDREVMLHVEGQSMTLTKDQSITLDLPRMFAWRVDERLPQTERVAENHSGHEVLIRP